MRKKKCQIIGLIHVYKQTKTLRKKQQGAQVASLRHCRSWQKLTRETTWVSYICSVRQITFKKQPVRLTYSIVIQFMQQQGVWHHVTCLWQIEVDYINLVSWMYGQDRFAKKSTPICHRWTIRNKAMLLCAQFLGELSVKAVVRNKVQNFGQMANQWYRVIIDHKRRVARLNLSQSRPFAHFLAVLVWKVSKRSGLKWLDLFPTCEKNRGI